MLFIAVVLAASVYISWSTARKVERAVPPIGDFIEVAVGWMSDCAFDPARVELGFGRDDDPLPAWEIELDGGRRRPFV